MADKQEQIIVLNRMYSGAYLSTNLGHEVINMFQADDGKHYLYLNARGNLSPDAKNAKNMLLVVHLGKKRVEIVGLAKNLTPIDSAMGKLPKEISEKTKNGEKQEEYIKNNNICYGGVPLLKIFNGSDQQEIYISYVVDKDNFFVPKKSLILCYDEENKKDEDFLMSEHKFPSTSLRQYIRASEGEGNDFANLTKIINDPNNWEQSKEKKEKKEKVEINENFEPWEPSLIDICGIQNNENCFSNALSYFMQKYPELWCEFFNKKLGININSFSIKREVYAKSKKENLKDETGGRIDMLLYCPNDKNPIYYIIIENKIKSDIIVDKQDNPDNTLDKEQVTSQLDKYWNYVKSLNEGHPEENIKGFVLTPDYNMPDLSKYNSGTTNFEPLKYSEICEHLKDNAIVNNDVNFKAFYKAMQLHSEKSEPMALYEDMKQKFFTRIYKMQKNQSNY